MNIGVYVAKRSGLLTDWNGREIKIEALSLIKTGHIVRIAIRDDNIGWSEAVYVEIVNITNAQILTGKVLGTYRHTDPALDDMEPIADGECISFKLDCIIEIPFHWDANKDLSDAIEQFFTGRLKPITGLDSSDL